MLNYTIVVDDNGELKSVQASEIDALSSGEAYPDLAHDLNNALNSILDKRAADAHNAAIKAQRKA